MSNTNLKNEAEENRIYRYKAGAFLASVAGIAAVAGFSKTLMTAKKKDPSLFTKGTIVNIDLLDRGSVLAMRALAWGTFYAVLGTGTICFSIWKLSGAKNMTEFREKMGKGLPRLTSNEPPTSRTEFEGLTDLMKYISTWGKE